MKASQRKDGRWECKGVEPVTGRRISYYGKTEAEALRKASGESLDTLIGYYENVYLPTVRMRSQNYRLQISWAFDQWIAPEFGDTNLVDIDRVAIQRFFNGVKGLKPISMRHVRNVLRAILGLAEDDGLIPKNPVLKVRLPAIQSKEIRTFALAELKHLMASAKHHKPLILLLGGAGLRVGEACAAQWPKAGVLSVRQQIIQVPGQVYLSPNLKTANAYRDIPLPFLTELGEPRVWICEGRKGGYMTPCGAEWALKQACMWADLEPIGPHAMRHSFITAMENELEAPRRVVQALVGHAGKEITDGYSKVSLEAKNRWMQRFHNSTGFVVHSDDKEKLGEAIQA